jgi:hypothetical protein
MAIPYLRRAAAVGAAALLAASAPADAGRVVGGPTSELIRGSADADTLSGRGGNDVLHGRRGRDRIFGGDGDDRVDGGPGSDRLTGGAGNDRISAGSGRDAVNARDGRTGDVVDCGPGRDRLLADAGDRHRRCERLSRRPSANVTRPVTTAPQPQGGAPATAPPTGQPGPSAAAGGVAADRRMSGTLSTVVQEASQCGAPRAPERHQMPAVLTVAPPQSAAPAQPGFPAAAGADDNPLRLHLGQLSTADNIRPGSVFLNSVLRFGATSPPLILKYWDLAVDGARITGTLVDDQRGQAAAANLLAAQSELVPCRPNLGVFPNQYGIARGATLAGTLTPTSADLTVRGQTIDGTRAFAARFTGRI